MHAGGSRRLVGVTTQELASHVSTLTLLTEILDLDIAYIAHI